jgi:hypothetical protein
LSLTNISAVKRYTYLVLLKRFINLRRSSSAVLDYFRLTGKRVPLMSASATP